MNAPSGNAADAVPFLDQIRVSENHSFAAQNPGRAGGTADDFLVHAAGGFVIEPATFELFEAAVHVHKRRDVFLVGNRSELEPAYEIHHHEPILAETPRPIKNPPLPFFIIQSSDFELRAANKNRFRKVFGSGFCLLLDYFLQLLLQTFRK